MQNRFRTCKFNGENFCMKIFRRNSNSYPLFSILNWSVSINCWIFHTKYCSGCRCEARGGGRRGRAGGRLKAWFISRPDPVRAQNRGCARPHLILLYYRAKMIARHTKQFIHLPLLFSTDGVKRVTSNLMVGTWLSDR